MLLFLPLLPPPSFSLGKGRCGELQDGEVGRLLRNLLHEGTEREKKLQGLPSLSRIGVSSFLQ